MPTRFTYTAVPSDHFSLTPVEILMATDGELNQYMSIKRIAPYKNKAAWDKDKAAKLKALKETINGRTWGGVPVDELSWNENGANGGDGRPAKKRKGKKERLKAKKMAESQSQEEGMDQHHSPGVTKHIEDEEGVARPRKKRRKNRERAE
jgi:protein KRI1